MAKNETLVIVVIVAIGAWLLLGGGNPFGGDDDDGGDDGGGSVVPGCSVDQTTFTPKMTRLGKAGTALNSNVNYFVLSPLKASVAGGTASTFSPGDVVKILYGENATTYYSKEATTTIPCAGTHYADIELAYAGLSSVWIENENGQVNSGSAQQSMTADDTFDAKITLKGVADQYFGNPDSSCRNIGLIEYDKTYILKAEGEEGASVPRFATHLNTTYDGWDAFYIPKVGSNEDVSFSVQITSTGTQPTGNHDPILRIFDCDIDKDADSLALIHSVEDEDGNILSLANQSIRVYLS